MTVTIEGGSTTGSTRPWVERYRPKTLQDVSHQQEVVATLQNAVETGRLPHLLLYGPPGSGKTSVALALCRQLWHPSQWKRRVLELNASDERGISVVRDKIKHFASLSVGKTPLAGTTNNNNNSSTKSSIFSTTKKSKTVSTNEKNKESSSLAMEIDSDDEKKYPNPPFKIIILDEADTVTPDAQAALRRIIEAHSRITRFILICNYVTRIIEPLASRCAKFRFQPLPGHSMKERLEMIADAENFSTSERSLIDEILKQSNGDMRRAVTTLQSVHSLVDGNDDDVSPDLISEIAGIPNSTAIDELWNALSDTTTSSFDNMNKAVINICAAGYSAQSLLTVLLPNVVTSDTLSEVSKSKIAIRMAEAEKNMIDGADEYLQLMTVCSLMLSCFQQDNAK